MDAHKNQDEKQTKAMDDEITWGKNKTKRNEKNEFIENLFNSQCLGFKINKW